MKYPAQTLHFRMNRTDLGDVHDESRRASSSPQLYQFEDEAFATVPELVLHHVTKQVGKQPIDPMYYIGTVVDFGHFWIGLHQHWIYFGLVCYKIGSI